MRMYRYYPDTVYNHSQQEYTEHHTQLDLVLIVLLIAATHGKEQ